MPRELSARIKVWRSRHSVLLNQSKAARVLIQRGLEADAPAPASDRAPADEIASVPKTKPWRDVPWNAGIVIEARTPPVTRESTSAQLHWLLDDTGRAKREVIEAALNRERGVKVGRSVMGGRPLLNDRLKPVSVAITTADGATKTATAEYAMGAVQIMFPAAKTAKSSLIFGPAHGSLAAEAYAIGFCDRIVSHMDRAHAGDDGRPC